MQEVDGIIDEYNCDQEIAIGILLIAELNEINTGLSAINCTLREELANLQIVIDRKPVR
jgi:hypothetical protein